MASPIKRQREKLLKQKQNQADTKFSGAEPKSLHLLLAELDNDKKVLKGFNRIEDKVAHKRDVLVPKYRQAVEEYLESEELFDNPVFANMVVWLFDTEDLETAITWCDKAIANEMDSPFQRDFATFCADTVLKWSEKMASQGHAIEPYFSQVFTKIREEWRINEQLTAKWYKFAGQMLLRDEDGAVKASSVGDIETLEKAHALLTEADKQYAKSGVGTLLSKIEQRIRALQDGTNL